MSHLLHVNISALHPWMLSDLLDSWSFSSVIAEHFDDEILEIVRQVLSTCLFPVSVVVTIQQQIVEVLVLLGLLKWENTLNDNEKNDSSGEHINLGTVIVLILFNFGCHISHRTSV